MKRKIEVSSTKDFLILGLYAHRKSDINQVHIHECTLYLIKASHDKMIKVFSGPMADCVELYKEIIPHLDA